MKQQSASDNMHQPNVYDNNILHSNFPIERSVNPTKFDHLMSEWTHTLDNYFEQHKDALIFNCHAIFNDLNYPGLYTALSQYIGQHKLIFDYQLPYFSNISYWSYLRFLLCKPYQVENRLDEMNGTLIHLQRAESISLLIRNNTINDRSCKLFIVNDFKQSLSQYTQHVDFLFDYLQSIAVIHVQGNTVKVSSDPILISDHQILSVKNTLNTLLQHSSQLESDIAMFQAQIIANKANKSKALFFLKRKKQTMHILEQRQTTINTLQDMLMKIDQCETDKQIIDAYQDGSLVIKNILKEYGLSVDKVQDTMEMVQQTLADADEVQQVMPNVEIDEDIELEFKEMLKELDNKLELEDKHWPSVPAKELDIIEKIHNEPEQMAQ